MATDTEDSKVDEKEKPMANKLMQDDNGNTSSMRFITMIAGVVIVGIFGLTNLAVIIKGLFMGQAIDIVDFKPYMVGALTAILTGKVGQKFAEILKK